MGPGRGGARPGAGRPRNDEFEAEDDPVSRGAAIAEFNEQKARHERLKADEREFNLEVSRGNYLPRDVQRQASATALAVLTQSLRSIPDNLEREFSLKPEVAEAIAVQIDSALAEIAGAFKAMTNEG